MFKSKTQTSRPNQQSRSMMKSVNRSVSNFNQPSSVPSSSPSSTSRVQAPSISTSSRSTLSQKSTPQAQNSSFRKSIPATKSSITAASRSETLVTFPIDLVYTWVDGSDEEWLQTKEMHEREQETTQEGNSIQRWRDLDELKYSIESALYFAPWIRNIFVISDHQRPYWYDERNPGKVHFIDHPQLYGEFDEHLPVFNSHSIESHLHRIPGLSEHFLYANDDTFFGNHVSPQDFFTGDGKFKVFLMEYDMETEKTFQVHLKEMKQSKPQSKNMAQIVQQMSKPRQYSSKQANGSITSSSTPPIGQQFAVTPFITAQVHVNTLLDRVMGKSDIPRKRLFHQIRPMKRCVFEFCWDNEEMQVYLFNTSSTKFRSLTDVDPIALVCHAGLVLGEAVPGVITSKYYSLNDDFNTIRKIFYHLSKQQTKPKLYCINDDMDNPDPRLIEAIATGLDKYLPHRIEVNQEEEQQ